MNLLILMWILLLTLSAIPLLRLGGAVLSRHSRATEFPRISSFQIALGKWEYAIGPLRDRFIAAILFLSLAASFLFYRENIEEYQAFGWIAFVLIYQLNALLCRNYRDGVRLKLAELARLHSNIHPQDFFNLYYALLSPCPPVFPKNGFRVLEFQSADFRTGEAPKVSRYPLVPALLATQTLASLAILAFQKVGSDFGRDAFDGLARLWGSRVAQLFKISLKTTGAEQIPPLEGKVLLVLNHVSYLDFVFNFFCLGVLRKKSGRFLRPRFIAAKDHFIDKKLVYSVLKLGQVIENAGMVFVNRYQKGKGWAAMAEAAEKLVQSDVEIAVFPQGTRSYPMTGAHGQRADSGFYSSLRWKSWDRPLGHLKIGTAHLILDSLVALRKCGEKQLQVLAIGIEGAGTVGPKGSFHVQGESEIVCHLAPLWVLSTDLALGIQSPEGREPRTAAEELYVQRIGEIQSLLNQKMLEALDWHAVLRKKVREELASQKITPKEIWAFETFLNGLSEKSDSWLWILLDRWLSLPFQDRLAYFLKIQDLVGLGAPEIAWKPLLEEVSRALLKKPEK